MVKKGKLPGPTPEQTRVLCNHIRGGMHYEPACDLAGIDYRTFYHWRRKGETLKEGYEQYYEFVQALKRAEAEAEQSAVEAWMNGFDGDWKAAERFLTKRYPERWGDRSELGVEGGGGMITVVIQRRKDDKGSTGASPENKTG